MTAGYVGGDMEFYLASGSPRRFELLRQIGITPHVIVPEGVEEAGRVWESPSEMVKNLSLEKAREVAGKVPLDGWILGADTIVFQGENIFGKPRNKEDARRILEELSGKTHQVLTGLTLIFQDKLLQSITVTKVHFHTLSESDIDDYLFTGESMDKAGAYGIQGKGAVFVKKIDGCYFNVVGLPLSTLWKMMKEMREET